MLYANVRSLRSILTVSGMFHEREINFYLISTTYFWFFKICSLTNIKGYYVAHKQDGKARKTSIEKGRYKGRLGIQQR
jgi:hypothetical protein